MVFVLMSWWILIKRHSGFDHLLNSEIRQHIIQLAKGLWLLSCFLEPCDVIGIFQALDHLLINFNGQDDRDGLAFSGHDFRFRCLCFHGE